jgi:hypothetical protein
MFSILKPCFSDVRRARVSRRATVARQAISSVGNQSPTHACGKSPPGGHLQIISQKVPLVSRYSQAKCADG